MVQPGVRTRRHTVQANCSLIAIASIRVTKEGTFRLAGMGDEVPGGQCTTLSASSLFPPGNRCRTSATASQGIYQSYNNRGERKVRVMMDDDMARCPKQ